ncbi:MAG: YraN family protein [Planctomycetota bacterium]
MPAWLSRLLPDPPPLGKRGEHAAARYLRRRGYRVVARGRRGRLGELDLVAVWRKQTVVFVEVKTRRNRRAGSPAEAVSAEQRQRILRGGLEFLKRHDLLDYPSRFDVIAIVWPPGARRPESIEHFENALQPDDAGQFYA